MTTIIGSASPWLCRNCKARKLSFVSVISQLTETIPSRNPRFALEFFFGNFQKDFMPIYTRTGDKGKTSLYGGKRVSKADIRVDTYGTVDELNSMLGAVVAQLSKKEAKLKKEIELIQKDLLTIGASLANPSAKPQDSLEERVKTFEGLIDRMTEKLPELRNFILPGGGKAGSLLHVARTICRRAERRLVALMEEDIIDDQVVKYINRLSDVLFTMARYVNQQEKKRETIWSSYAQTSPRLRPASKASEDYKNS